MRPAPAWTLAALLLGAGCASAGTGPPGKPRVHQYRVLLLPVEGVQAALEEAPGPDGMPFTASAAEVRERIRDAILGGGLFSEVVVAGDGEGGPFPGDGDASWIEERARRLEADLVLRVWVKSARITELGRNSSAFWSTFLWFMIPAPVWSVDDRSYRTDMKVQAELFTPDDLQRPAASIVASSGIQTLDLWDRGVNLLVLVVPPPYLGGNPGRTGRILTERALREVTTALVEEIRRREVPSRFELDLVPSPTGVEVVATSRRPLRWLEVRMEGRTVAVWAETGLVPEPGGGGELLVYRRHADIARTGAGGSVVRVIAEDEIGGREIRTALLGGGP